MIDPEAFAGWMAAFTARLGKPLDERAHDAYYAALAAEMDTPTFERAAQRVFTAHEFNTWPAPIEFLAAAASVRRDPLAAINATYARIDAERAIPIPAPDTIEAFRAEWQTKLATCEPGYEARERIRRLLIAAEGPTPENPWASDPTPPGRDAVLPDGTPAPSLAAIAQEGA